MTREPCFALFALLVHATCSVAARAADTTVAVRTRDELQQAVAEAKPGTTIAVAPGTYEGGLTFARLQGTADRPIRLAAADPAQPPVIQGGSFCLHLTEPAHVELHHWVLEQGRGNGLNIDDGGSIDRPAHHVVLRGLVIRDIGSDRNHDGIKLSGVDDFRIENCTIRRWGKQGSAVDLVGCHRGTILKSTFRDGDPRSANGVQIKGGSSDVTIRRCRFENAGGRGVNLGGSTGAPYFRPAKPGYEAKSIIVEDSTFVGSMAAVAFVGVDGATVRHNTFYRPTRWLIRILQENQDPNLVPSRNGTFANNIVAFQSGELAAAVNVGPGTSPESFRFSGNFWYCLDRPQQTRRAVALPTPESDGTYGQDPQFRNPNEHDFESGAAGSTGLFGPRAGEGTRPIDSSPPRK